MEMLFNATIGVPVTYACPLLLSRVELYCLVKKTGAISSIPTEAVDILVGIARVSKTTDLYDTEKQVIGNTLKSDTKKWTIKQEHDRVIKAIAKRFGITPQEVMFVDQGIHIKRARANQDPYGKKSALVSGGRFLFLYVCNNPIHNGHACAWFDISYSPAPPPQGLGELSEEVAKRSLESKQVTSETLIEKRVPRFCVVCLKWDTKRQRNKQCGKCKKVSYCSRLCQLENWKVHKNECMKPARSN